MSVKKPIVLMYHGIVGHFSKIPSGREEGAEIYDLPHQRFFEQMRHSKENGERIEPLRRNGS